MLTKLKLFLFYYKFPCPNRKTFCHTANMAYVKCTDCGASSIPWPVSPRKAENFIEVFPLSDQFTELMIIDRKEPNEEGCFEFRLKFKFLEKLIK